MQSDIKRSDTVYTDEKTRRSIGSAQWLLEKRNTAATHPISHNNPLTFFTNGEESFSDIANQIRLAKESIDLCCWGFDPAMELQRGQSQKWPRGPTFGDLLIEAGERGVQVRLLVWCDFLAGGEAKNMPGHTHNRNKILAMMPIGLPEYATQKFESAILTLESVKRFFLRYPRNKNGPKLNIELEARSDYCINWYQAAFDNKFKGVSIRTRDGNSDAAAESLRRDPTQPRGLKEGEFEKFGMVYFATHHQKPILIDFYYQQGSKAVGYVMGLNSITDYWDTNSHSLENSQREQTIPDKKSPFVSAKPYRDYACRIDGGRALVALYNNFVKAWERTDKDRKRGSPSEIGSRPPPNALLRPHREGDSTVQILLTEPEGKDKTIQELYINAAITAALGSRYIYIENQYFQWEYWARTLLETGKKVAAAWVASKNKLADLPMLHVFLVVPLPERTVMIPRMYEALAGLGQEQCMSGQVKLIKHHNEQPPNYRAPLSIGVHHVPGTFITPAVIRDANQIHTLNRVELKEKYNMKISTVMLASNGWDGKNWFSREIYIHSKLLLIDDVFITLGSANLNQRSMSVDSEMNLATIDPSHAKKLRETVWSQLTGGEVSVENGTSNDVKLAFKIWEEVASANGIRRTQGLRMKGHVTTLSDDRSSLIRLG